MESGLPQLRQDLHRLVLPRLTDEDVRHLTEPGYGPWQAWRTAAPRIDLALREKSPTFRPLPRRAWNQSA